MLLEAEAPAEYHEKAAEYYGKGLEGALDPGNIGRYVEIVYHLMKAGKDEESFGLYSQISGMLERVRERAVEISEMILARVSEEDERAFVLITLGNFLLKGRELGGAGRRYDEALSIYRRLGEKDPIAYESDVANLPSSGCH